MSVSLQELKDAASGVCARLMQTLVDFRTQVESHVAEYKNERGTFRQDAQKRLDNYKVRNFTGSTDALIAIAQKNLELMQKEDQDYYAAQNELISNINNAINEIGNIRDKIPEAKDSDEVMDLVTQIHTKTIIKRQGE